MVHVYNLVEWAWHDPNAHDMSCMVPERASVGVLLVGNVARVSTGIPVRVSRVHSSHNVYDISHYCNY